MGVRSVPVTRLIMAVVVFTITGCVVWLKYNPKITLSQQAFRSDGDFNRKWTAPQHLAPCGQACSYTGEIVKSDGISYPQLYKDINCRDIISRMAWKDYTIEDPPPEYPPKELLDQFTMNGDMPIKSINYFKPQPSDGNRQFLQSTVDKFIAKLNKGEQVNHYNASQCVEDTIKKYNDGINNKHGVVIGTIRPWLESILLANGARFVTTLEYTEIDNRVPMIETYTPYTYAEMFLKGDCKQFDFGASFSSIEHSGLGRYTDPLNPYGDLEAMAQVWCMMKPGGIFVVGVPFLGDDSNFIVWNAHRVYGLKRMQHLTANWELLDVVPCINLHRVFVLRKPISN